MTSWRSCDSVGVLLPTLTRRSRAARDTKSAAQRTTIALVYSRAQLADDFRTLGLVPGDVVMVHASVRSLGEVAGGPDQIHRAIKDAVTDAGTMMMYASCPDYVDDIGRGVYPGSKEREILEKLPPFDPLTARAARDNGALVEPLRTIPTSGAAGRTRVLTGRAASASAR